MAGWQGERPASRRSRRGRPPQVAASADPDAYDDTAYDDTAYDGSDDSAYDGEIGDNAEAAPGLPVAFRPRRRPHADERDERNGDDEDDEAAPLIRPTLTLPTVTTHTTHATRAPHSGPQRAPRPAADAWETWEAWDEGAEPANDDGPLRPTLGRSRATTQAQPLAPRTSGKQRAVLPLEATPPALSTPYGRRSLPPRQPKPSRALATLHAVGDALGETVFIPGRRMQRRLPPALRARLDAAAGVSAIFLKRQRVFLLVLVLLTVLTGVVANAVGVGHDVGLWSASAWRSLSGITVAPPPPAPDSVDPAHYVAQYGFDWPHNTLAIPSDERQRLISMLPFALQATAAYDFRYHKTIEPEMLLWWTHAEGIKGRINYSNCANQSPRPGANYFTDIENCSESSFWQLGYGNQFSVIYVLKNAFRDLHGNPDDPRLVQRVGQAVLNYDASQGTVPACGGYSCTFPTQTIDQIMAGVNQATGVETADNWWASVLSRDPAINCYMIAHALTYFNHAATKRWVGCYYYEPCWGYESDRLGDILAAWPGLRRAAGV